MAIDFPASPTTGQTFTSGSVTYTWDGVKWTAVAAGGGATDKITEGNTSAEVIDTGSDGRFVVTTEGTEALRVDASRRLLVGTSTSASTGNAQYSRFQIQGDTSFNRGTMALRCALAASSIGLNEAIGEILFTETTGGTFASIYCAADGTAGSGDYPASLRFQTTADGASSPTERMRITSAGDFLYGCTSGSGSSDVGVKISDNTNNPWLRIVGNEPTSSNFFLSGCNTNPTNNGFRFYVKFDGGIVNYSGNNVNLCDEREKKNIETLNSTWGCLKSWELKKFHYNEDADTDDKRYGVIAQQVQTVCPEVITEWVKQKAEDAVFDEDGNVVTPAVEEVTRMGVKEQQMMWMAIKALQEAQTRIETLEAEVAALKAQ